MDLKRGLEDKESMDFAVKRSKPENYVSFRLLVPWAVCCILMNHFLLYERST